MTTDVELDEGVRAATKGLVLACDAISAEDWKFIERCASGPMVVIARHALERRSALRIAKQLGELEP